MISLAQAAYEQIRRRIVCGELTTETSLSETSLAQELQVSRTPIREAIRRLECEGLLEQRPKQGTFVRAPNRREMRELMELRIYLEPPAAARVTRRQRPALIRELSELVVEMKHLVALLEKEVAPYQAVSLQRRHMACDRAFHEAMIRESGNRRVSKVIYNAGILSLVMGFFRDRPSVRLQSSRQANCEHEQILQAICQGEPQRASRTMRSHLVQGLHKAMDYYNWLEQNS